MSTCPPSAQICLSSAREDLQAIVSAISWQWSSQHWFHGRNRGQLHAERKGLFRGVPVQPRNACQVQQSATECNIASATPTCSLVSKTPNIGFMVETAADLMPIEEDFSESVFRGVPVLQEPTSAWQVFKKTSRPLPVPITLRNSSEAHNHGFKELLNMTFMLYFQWKFKVFNYILYH